jgi:hypothetical protein
MEGHFQKVFNQVKFMVEEEVSHTLGVPALAIALVANKTFLFEHLLNKDGKGLVEVSKGNKLHQVMDKFIALSSPNFQNLIVSFKHQPGNKRYVSNILDLKTNNGYCFI